MKKNILFVLGAMVLLHSCIKNKPSSYLSTEITVDVEKCISLPLEKGRIIPLETSDSSLLYDIISVEQIEDRYFIQTRNKVLTFDVNGNYLYNISNVGQSGQEYIKLSSFFAKNNELYLYDASQQRILVFAPSGNYLRTEKIIKKSPNELTFALIHPWGKDKYIAKNTFNGTPGVITPSLSILNNKYDITDKLGGRFLQTGFFIYDFVNCNSTGNFSIYWEALNDTIYTIEKNKMVQPKYIVNFGEYAIPDAERFNKDVYDLLDYVKKTDNKKVAAFIRYVYEEEKYVYFVFFTRTKEGKDYYTRLALYNKDTHHTITYTLPSEVNEKYKIGSFLKINNEQVIMSLENCENIEHNQSLFIIDKKELYEK